jgi:hypothetical protein
MLLIADKYPTNLSEATREINATTGFGTVVRSLVDYYKKRRASGEPRKPPGPHPQAEFEKYVIDSLLFLSVNHINNEDQAEVVGNVMHSYEVIREMASIAQKEPRWALDESVQALKFSNNWIHKCLSRNGLRRRKITTDDKFQRPDPEEVRPIMQQIQQKIKELGLGLEDVVNADETGVFFATQPTHQYVPAGCPRASAAEGDNNRRYTVLLWASADGVMHEPFGVLGCAMKGADLSGSRILTKMMKKTKDGQPPVFDPDEWDYGVWARRVALTLNGKATNLEYHRPFVRSRTTNAVFTIHPKAWMDSVGLVMWAELQLGPWARSGSDADGHGRRRRLLVWDNCGAHKVEAVVSAVSSYGIEVANLPPKMTDRLQVMDLCVNRPLKACLRRARCRELLREFLIWRADWAARDAGGGHGAAASASEVHLPAPHFEPPPPNASSGIRGLLSAMPHFASEEMRECIARKFVAVGLAPDPQFGGAFRQYTGASLRVEESDLRGILVSDIAAPLEVAPVTASEVQAESEVDLEDGGEGATSDSLVEQGVQPSESEEDVEKDT